ncbi:MAG: hypothetical protein R2769_01875 [Saprospiraceae bacterium]
MHGEISVQSPPTGVNSGTEFTVRLPIHTNATLVKMDYNQKSGSEIKINGRPKEAPVIVLEETDQSTDSEAPVILLAKTIQMW